MLPLCYRLTDPKQNVNWVFGFGGRPQKRVPRLVYLGQLMIGFPVLIYLPTHLRLQVVLG